MSWYTDMLVQSMTYWNTSGTDDFSNPNITSPEVLDCRWEDKEEIFKDKHGNEKVSKSIIYTTKELSTEGFLQEGEHSGTNIDDADEIQAVRKIPSIDGDEYEYKVWL